jgi:hypothetical protein
MTMRIRITAGNVGVTAQLHQTATARAIWDALPITGRANTWGDEIYFSIPVRMDEEDAQAVVAKGDVGYWPPGRALCIFFGPTPVSPSPDEIRPASPVNVVGRIEGDPSPLKGVCAGDSVRVERA